ncbi:ATP synthase subunit f, mitochondrial-like [Amphiura filiformis]|uniref:ATP synthase subunit f, mitochondrial-like n=1 Tax=Amphiura filiformis TaxID=82378 RepID=UPI003B21967A
MAGKSVTELPLREVKVGQLPKWLASLNYRPSGVMGAFWRGVDRYNAKYVNVIKGNATPVFHICATILVVSYIWRFKQEKHHRHRKHHW